MPDFDALRKKFYEDDDDENLFTDPPPCAAVPSGSGSGSAPGRSSATAVNSSSPRPRSRPHPRRATAAPYPQRPSSSGSGLGSSSDRNTHARSKARQRAAASPPDVVLGGALQADDGDPLALLAGSTTTASEGKGKETQRVGSDVDALMRAWQNERHAPDILPAQDELLSRVLDTIRRQMRDVQTLRSAAAAGSPVSEEDHYMLTLVQIEVERVGFVVRSYVRTRLFKIEQFAAHITSTPDVMERLTESELRHAQSYARLIVRQFHTTVLGNLPESQQGLDDSVLGVPNMITAPNKNKPVFFRAREPIERLMHADGKIEQALIPPGAVLLVPYRVIEQNLLRGEVELV